ncbi:MAG: hypothetical protein JJU29_12405 [Verrucomicrobia bacterium]|nr:hypothetical protein [Verrucomicrobiota bacterium]
MNKFFLKTLFALLLTSPYVSAGERGEDADAASNFGCPTHVYAVVLGEFMEIPFDQVYARENRWSCSFENEDLLVRIYYVDGNISSIEAEYQRPMGSPISGPLMGHINIHFEDSDLTPNPNGAYILKHPQDKVVNSLILMFEVKHMIFNPEGFAPSIHRIYQESEARQIRLQHAYVLSCVLFLLLCVMSLFVLKIRKRTGSDHPNHLKKHNHADSHEKSQEGS